ncbi:hypothetical protein J437_LFUL010625 [Ladona fulva]|uniref:Chitin-binding type-2 domain-containing protein n=1 Tax=Ladona fulva TaxID=123851 RepID=A0A8K0P2K3_LADFU|nr:hypothetical protein J437_LFUL010625 [Ladona fulva]
MYFLQDGEVFEFRCSTGLLFDINRQICDFKFNVDNCHITAEVKSPRPLLDNANCPEEGDLGCADGTCLPHIDNDPNAAVPCDPLTCKLPDCFCSFDGTAVPGNLLPSQEFSPVEVACNLPKTCRLQSRDLGGERYLYTCTSCPQMTKLGIDIAL